MEEDKIEVTESRDPTVLKLNVKFLIFKYTLLSLITITIIAYSIEIPFGIRVIKELKHANSNTAFVGMPSNSNEDIFDRYINFDYDRTNPLSLKLFKR